ncbi:MAG: UxaA family hydrolase [Clostridia bacterium]|nr:UxaA family hydrolase [Clostridia bacterium]
MVHERRDNVGVSVDDIDAGEQVEGMVLEDQGLIVMEAREAIPFGHKIALNDIASGAEVTRYASCIGVATQQIVRGEHVHTHNVKSARC